ncbi:PAN/Apple domain-containing protein [Devosia sp. A8/3-2]|nr:PAN/Apple domain-containing protein [Devosia sp. A8/3-2]
MGKLRALRWLGAAVLMGLSLVSAQAADVKVTLLENTDLPGFDYSIIKDTDLDACRSACVDDNICRAFTFNAQSNWCFLKGDTSETAEFAGATSGRVSRAPSLSVTEAARQAELPFPPQDLISQAKSFATALPSTDAPPPKTTYADLVAAAEQAVAEENPAGAIVAFRQAPAINANDRAVWQSLADVALARAKAVAGQAEGDNSYDLASTGTSAAMNAFLRSTERDDRAVALKSLAEGMEYREMWREVIATYRASLALAPSKQLQAHLDDVIAQHGFRITSHEVDAESASPRICVLFSDPLPSGSTDLSGYVVVPNAAAGGH